MTQEELARSVGVTRQTIIAIEKGKYLPSLPLAFKLAKTLNTTIEELFIYDETYPNHSSKQKARDFLSR